MTEEIEVKYTFKTSDFEFKTCYLCSSSNLRKEYGYKNE